VIVDDCGDGKRAQLWRGGEEKGKEIIGGQRSGGNLTDCLGKNKSRKFLSGGSDDDGYNAMGMKPGT
jgi:hypothetical protein